MEEEVQWVMKDWPEEWKVSVISKIVPKYEQKVEIEDLHNSQPVQQQTQGKLQSHKRNKG
jgi:hypothetical protein